LIGLFRQAPLGEPVYKAKEWQSDHKTPIEPKRELYEGIQRSSPEILRIYKRRQNTQIIGKQRLRNKTNDL
jgi:hypothetical protein